MLSEIFNVNNARIIPVAACARVALALGLWDGVGRADVEGRTGGRGSRAATSSGRCHRPRRRDVRRSADCIRATLVAIAANREEYTDTNCAGGEDGENDADDP